MPHIPGHSMPRSAEDMYQADSVQQPTQTSTPTPTPSTVNPYQYYQEFTSNTPTYGTEQAYSDIGISPTLDFLNQTDPITGLSYADLIPEYDPFNEEMLRTRFRSGVQEGYQGAVGQLGGIMEQATEQLGQSGFTSSGAIQSAIDTSRSGLQNQYGSAFSDALLSLTSGIRQERLGYQESISDLLTSFQEKLPGEEILTTQTLGEQRQIAVDEMIETIGYDPNASDEQNFQNALETYQGVNELLIKGPDGKEKLYMWNPYANPPQYQSTQG